MLVRSLDLLYIEDIYVIFGNGLNSTHQYRSPTLDHKLRTSPWNPNSHNHFKMKFALLAAAFAASSLALPDLLARDNVKLNQYRTLDDW